MLKYFNRANNKIVCYYWQTLTNLQNYTLTIRSKKIQLLKYFQNCIELLGVQVKFIFLKATKIFIAERSTTKLISTARNSCAVTISLSENEILNLTNSSINDDVVQHLSLPSQQKFVLLRVYAKKKIFRILKVLCWRLAI